MGKRPRFYVIIVRIDFSHMRTFLTNTPTSFVKSVSSFAKLGNNNARDRREKMVDRKTGQISPNSKISI